MIVFTLFIILVDLMFVIFYSAKQIYLVYVKYSRRLKHKYNLWLESGEESPQIRQITDI